MKKLIIYSIFLAVLSIPALTAGDSPRVIFVTSITGTGDLGSWPDAGIKTGLEAADEICFQRASAASLDNAEQFVAVISDSEDDAYCRLHGLTGKRNANCGQADLPGNSGPWVRTDGVQFADRTPFSLSSTYAVYNPPFFDEFGNPVPLLTRAWTGSSSFGQGTSSTCNEWTSADAGDLGLVGSTDGTAGSWITFGVTTCSASRPLYCMEPLPGPSLAFPDASERFVFMTEARSSGDLSTNPLASKGTSGIAAGDSVCNNEAQAAGLPDVGHYKAWLSDDSEHARDRFENDGAWFRVDGFKVAENMADLIDGELITSIHLTASGVYRPNTGVWTGTASDGTATGTNCDNWTSANNNGTGGRANIINEGWTTQDASADCDGLEKYLYCLSDKPQEILLKHGYEREDQ